MLNYVKEKRQDEIALNSEKEAEIEKTIEDIIKISKLNKPPTLRKLSYCTKCAYYEFCFVKEEE